MQLDFEIQDAPFYFMSDKTTNLKLSFEQCILKIPKYQLETSLYNALLNKMSPEKPLKMCWESNDILVHTIGKGIMQVRQTKLSLTSDI